VVSTNLNESVIQRTGRAQRLDNPTPLSLGSKLSEVCIFRSFRSPELSSPSEVRSS
jgi:hypothetical protein